MQNSQLDRRAQNTQLDRRVRYAQIEQRPSQSWKGFSSVVEGPAAWLTSFLLIPCLIAAALLLPPVNLWERLQLFAYTRIGVTGGVLSDADGTLVSFPPEGVQESFYAAFSSIPRIDFIEGQAGRQFYDAAVALPDYLIAKSPIYSLEVRGEKPGQVIFEIPIPNDSLPYETLGVYSWNGTNWEHLPSKVLITEDKVEARLTTVPPNFMVMQTSPDIPEVTANLTNSQQLPENVRVASEVRGGMILRGDGALSGEVPESTGNTLLLITNVENGSVRSDLINNLLLDPGQQDNQINAVEQVLLERNFRGAVVDYREVDALPSARADFVFLMTRMAERLHANNKELIVRVATPSQISADEWNTLGYDWIALSQVVDKLIIPAPLDPRAYRAGGEMDALLSWATEMVERRKLQIELPVQSVETVGNYLFVKGYKEALQPLLKEISAESNGQEISLTASNPRIAEQLRLDESMGSYYYTYTDDQGAQRTVYLEDATSISHKLNLLRKYNLVDVTLHTPESGDVDPNIWSVLLQFQTGVSLSTLYEPVSVAYTVYDADSNVVTNNVRPLTDPRLNFASNVELAKLRVEAQLVGSRGEALGTALSLPLVADNSAVAQNMTAKEGSDQAAVESTEIAMVESKPSLPRINANTIVNVRSGPGTTYNILGQIAPENSYQALSKDESGQWWQIDIGSSQSGWIANEFVAQSAEVAQVAAANQTTQPQVATTNNEVTAAAVETAAPPEPDFPYARAAQIVNLREGPGTGYSVLGQLNPGIAYKLLGKNEQGDWWQVEMSDGRPGWVTSQLVSTGGDVQSIAVAQDIPQLAAPAEQVAVTAPEATGGQNTAPAAPVAAPSGSGGFGYGVQAHMVHTGQEDKVMAMTTGMGFNWVKQQVEWKVFEASQGGRDFGALDNIVNAAAASGVNLLFSVVNAPAWAREPGFDGNVGGPPQNPQTYADFVGALAGKYCGTSLKMIEVWNEQNLHYEWGNKPLNAGEYVQLLAAGYNAIKSACPSMIVVSGALTPAGNNGSFAMDDLAYLEQMFQAGANNYLDAVGAHPSGYNVPPWATTDTACAEIQKTGNSFNGACDSPHHSWSFQSTMLGYRNIMNVYGASGKKIIPTEFGWAAGGAFDSRYAYANDNDYNEQAEWTVQAYQMMKSWGWVGPAFLWNLNFRVVANGTEKAQWGIVDPGWGPLPVYNALAGMAK
ncbi:MAG: SH3 domain-containing protein [Caldilineaceae bacterium]|nr:SH3 domain-containing protein [Caldilineaceae bacterium]